MRVLTSKKAAKQAVGEASDAADRASRRGLAAHSLGRKTPKQEVPQNGGAAYKPDREAYKRRPSPVSAVNELVKKGGSVRGVNVGRGYGEEK